MFTLLQDIRYSLRTFIKNPGFSVIGVLAIGLAIGATSAMFSVVNAVLLKPLSFANSGNVAILWESNPTAGFATFAVAPANFADWQKQSASFETMAAYQRNSFTLTGRGDAVRVPAALVSADYFRLVQTPALYGRTLAPEDAQKGKDHVVVLSHGFWMQQFGGDTSIIGQTITLNGEPYSVAGVMPPTYMYPTNTAMWAPTEVDGTMSRGAHFLIALGRLRPGVSSAMAQAEIKTIASHLEQTYPNTNKGWTARVSNLQDDLVHNIRPSLLILFGAVGFVLLIACANVANLLLARGTERAKEIAVRTAMGASRRRLVRQLLTESVLLSVSGGLAGVLLAYYTLRALLASAPANVPRLQETTMDYRVLLFTLSISLLTGLIFGLFPAFQVSRTNLHDTLKDSSRGSSGGTERRRMRSVLVIAEIALTIIVAIGAGLMIESLRQLGAVDPGFNSRNVLTAQLNLPDSRYGDVAKIDAFVNRLLDNVSTLPGVNAAATTSVLPLSGSNFSISFSVVGHPVAPENEPSGQMRFVTPGYFKTLQMKIVRGRGFEASDNAAGQPVAVINESLARQVFPNQDPIGQQMQIGYSVSKDPAAPRTIVGIVGDIHSDSLQTEPALQYYVPSDQYDWNGLNLVVRTNGDPALLANALRKTIEQVDPNLALFNVRPMDQVVNSSISQSSFATTLLAMFAAAALFLAAIGVYGVMAYSVRQRTHEIGIRMALGAKRSAILKMVLGEVFLLALIGVVLGIVGAAALTRLMTGMLYQVRAIDPLTFAAVSSLIISIAAVAGYLPAWRATRVDPMVALRHE